MAVYVFPCSNSKAYQHYVETIKTERTIDELNDVVSQNIINDIKNNVGSNYRIWGSVAGPKNQVNWENLQKGDLVVFYHQGCFIGTCKLKYKIRNEAVADHFWNRVEDKSFELIEFLEDFKEYNAPAIRPDGGKFIYQGFMKVNEENEAIIMNLLQNGEARLRFEGNKEGDDIMLIKDMINKAISEGHKQIILTGAPGTSKTYSIRKFVEEKTGEGDNVKDKKLSRFVQFHPSFDYSDFVEGIRPVVIDGRDNNSFVRTDGIFKAFCRKIIEENITDTCYFIIDEINRADLSKVFGELMFSLEKGYRGCEYIVQTQFSNIPCYKVNNHTNKAELITNDCFKDGFYIPENLIILGSMNDIDRSVSTFDFALRRRFEWISIDANETMEETLISMAKGTSSDIVKNVAKRICNMNEKLIENNKFGLNKDYYIGAAYFKDLDYANLENSLEQIFDHNIKSIIKEYTRGRNAQDIDELLKNCKNALLNINE